MARTSSAPTARGGRRRGRPRRLVIGMTIKEQVTTSFFGHLQTFVEAGWAVDLVCSPGPWPSGPPPVDVTVHEIAMDREIDPSGDVVALAKWIALLRRLRPTVVIGGSPKGALHAMLAARATGVPTRIYLHRGARWESMTGMGRVATLAADKATVRAATEVVAVSESLAELLQAEGVTRTRARVMGAGGDRGVDLERFHLETPPSAALPRSPAGDSGPLLGFIGRVCADKGMDVALAALDSTRAAEPEASLWVFGIADPTDPPAPEILARLESDPAVQWLGWRSDLPELLPALDVLLFPSVREGLPNAVIQAAACGVPTVGWDATGTRDAVSAPATGRLVPMGDRRAYLAAVAEVLSQPRGRYQRACRAWAQRFDSDALAAGWLALVEGRNVEDAMAKVAARVQLGDTASSHVERQAE